MRFADMNYVKSLFTNIQKQFICTNSNGCQKEGVNFLNLLQKPGGNYV